MKNKESKQFSKILVLVHVYVSHCSICEHDEVSHDPNRTYRRFHLRTKKRYLAQASSRSLTLRPLERGVRLEVPTPCRVSGTSRRTVSRDTENLARVHLQEADDA